MHTKQDQVTRIKARWLPDAEAPLEYSHVTTRFMPMVTGHKTGVEAVKAGLLQLVQISQDGANAFRPIFGAN